MLTAMNATTIMPLIAGAATITFKWFDYVVFGGMLAISVLIGIYFGFFSKQDTTEEYLSGGKKMKVVPIAMSLVASYISGFTLLAVPADVYMYGANYILQGLALSISTIAGTYICLPVFYKLELNGSYEYLHRRFDNRIRVFASFLYILAMVFFIPVVIYIPALAFSQATGINIHLITPVVCAICIFYTSIGGIKAVVWTDTVQMVLIVTSSIVVFFLGISSAGGFMSVWNNAVDSERLNVFDFDIDPTKRDSFWMFAFGSTVNYIFEVTISQAFMQRILALPTLKDAKRALAIFGIGVTFIISTSVFTGLIMYTIYYGCDPVASGQVKQHDQILPYYIIHVAANVPGLAGIFIAGIFSAALSTLSTMLNTLSGTIYRDIVPSHITAKISENQASTILKIIVITGGIICTMLVFVVEKLGSIVPLVISMEGIPAGPCIGLFLMGMLFPFANTKGALYGGITGLIFTSWIVLGTQYYKYNGMLQYPPKPLSTDECDISFGNFTSNHLVTSTLQEEEHIFILFRISYFYYTTMGTFVTMAVGLLISWFTCKDDPPVHRDLISPVVHFLLPNEDSLQPFRAEYLTVEKALHIISEKNEN